ncbi:ATP-grasp domain-containing protein [Aliarcobacter cryaerophilus]|uniref:ATP-grasp domain-containing protein n=1 Tax=Aliarcobacter cryaerophilus TaxID=28198 RepID=UPI0011E02822|nr:ATP-grasp domain-containing protein [Aliarcobacter cryaerophilus]
MRKVFILGGSQLQMDLILEAKKMFFYTIVLDGDKNCIGSKWCDEFLHIDFSNKELVLEKALEYKIDAILTSATELGNITACYVGEKLGLNTNSYECSINTTNKIRMKEVLEKNSVPIIKYMIINQQDIKNNEHHNWNEFPCIVKPSDSSAGRGVSYCSNSESLNNNLTKAINFSKNGNIIIEKYIEGKQFSVETISTNCSHSILTITREYIRGIPYIVETHQTIPATIEDNLQKKIEKFIIKILDLFNIRFGACHIEIRIDNEDNIQFIEIASRIGGWRTELINLVYGISYSQLLLFSSLGIKREFSKQSNFKATVKIILSYDDYLEYQENKRLGKILFSPVSIVESSLDYIGMNLCEAKGYYFILEDINEQI